MLIACEIIISVDSEVDMRGAGSMVKKAGKNRVTSRVFKHHPLTALMLASGMMPGWTLANDIIVYAGAGGSTNTSIVTNGVNTDITTATVRGQTGFNSFSNFTVDAGNTVNLHVPGGANNLVNLVHDSRAVINGTLNGLKGGKVGGNIIFADPHGFVVGASGVVNVGSLTVTTPNTATMNELHRIAAVDGAVTGDQADEYVAKLAAGELPSAELASDGSNAIVIQGMVNTNGSINLHGASVLVEATAKLQSGTDVAREVFNSTVNTEGLTIGDGVVRGDGGIVITATDNVEIAGELAALMADDSGAQVQVAARKSLELNGNALISAAGQNDQDGGDVTIESPSITLSDNARVVTRATGAGSSGDIALNALSDISCTFCDEDAEAQTLDELKNGIERQANPWLSANLGKAEIIIGENAELDAGHATGANAGDVTLDAYGLNRQMAGYAEASARIDVDGSITGRNVTITADARAGVARDILGMLLSKYDLKNDISQLASDNGWTEAETWANVLDTLADPIKAYAGTTDTNAFLETPTNFTELTLLVPNLSAYIAKADAVVDIGSTANIDTSEDLTAWASTSRNVSSSTWSIPVLGKKIPFGFDAAYGQISGLTEVAINDGATLNVGQDLTVVAHSDNSLSVTAAAENSVDGGGSALKTMGLGFGMAMSDISTRAVVADGVNLSVGRDVSVLALTEQELENSVSFKASGEGATGGPAVGVSLFNSDTYAEFSADLSGARNLNVNAANVVYKQITSVSVSAGASEPGYLDKLKEKASEQVAKPVTDYLGNSLKGLFGIKPESKEEGGSKPATDSQFRLASAIDVTLADHSVKSVLGGGSSAPVIDISGDLAVQAWQQQKSLHNAAESTVNASAKRDDGSTDGAEVSLSVAAVYTELDQQTHAIIGDGTQVTAGRIGVGARFDQPIGLLGLDRWSSLKQVYANLKLLSEGPQAVIGKIATQYANSTGEADKLGMAGSLSILQNRIDTQAWAGDNVNLTATSTDDAAWSSLLAAILPELDSTTALEARREALRTLGWEWSAPLQVTADNQLEQLVISGNFDGLFGTTSEDGGAVGAGLNIQITDNQAIAGIGANGSLTADAVNVVALQDELLIAVSPSAGKGASVAGNGSVVVSVVDSAVHSSIHSSTDVTADTVNIEAEHQLGLWSAAGAIAASENTGVGVGVAVNVVNTDVYALVGDNVGWRPDYLSAGLDDSSKGSWLVNDLTLSAQSSGQSGAFSIAGALARSEQEQEQQDEVASQSGNADAGSQEQAGSLGEAIKTSLTNGLALITGEVQNAKDKAVSTGEAAMDKISEYWGKLQTAFNGDSSSDGSDGTTKEGLSLAAAASGSINVSGQKNRAHLGNIVLDPRDSDGSKVNVLSLNQTHQFSGSGAGALTLSGGDKSQHSAALAGAVAYNQLNNVTEALMQDTVLHDNDLLKIQAASGGDQIAMGLGLAVAAGGESNVAVALSGSAGVFNNTTRAAVIDSEVEQRGAAPGTIAVNAYDRSRSLLGGGSFAVSKEKGGSAGGSMVLAIMGNELQAEWLGSSASDFDSFEVKANSASRVLAGALAVAASTGQQSGSGAGSLFVVVMNNKVKANVDKTDNGDSSLTGADVTVAAASVPGGDALNDIFNYDASADTTLSETGLDMTGSNAASQIEVESETNDELFSEDGIDTNTDESASTADTTTRNLFDSGDIAGEAVLAIAGSVAGTSGKTAVGGAIGVVYNGSDYSASVANTDIDLTGDLGITARNETDVLAGSIGAAVASNVSVAGSATALIGRGNVSAELDMTGRALKADDLTVQALKTGGFYSLAGSISGSTNTAAVGAAFSINDMQQSASANVTGGSYELTGDATLNAAQQSRIITAALSGAVSASGSGVGAAMTYNRIADTTTAELSSALMTARNLTISASQPNLGASIWSLAFNLAAGGGTAGVGAGVAVNLIDAERAAKLTDSTVNLSGDASLESALDGEIWSIGIDAAGGGTAGVGGSFAANNINGNDEVSISGSTVNATGSDQSLSLDASAGAGLTIASLAGSVTGGGTAAVGLAASVNRIAADRSALVQNSSVIHGFADASLKSGVEQAIYSIAIAGGGAGTVAVNGATTTNILDGEERAEILSSELTSVSNLSLSAAEGSRTIWGLGAVINGAGGTAVGAANVNNVILAKRIARIDESALSLSGTLNLASGGDALIRSAALGGGGAGTAAVGASIAVNVVDGEESASIEDSDIEGATALTVEVTEGQVDIKTLAGNVQGAGAGAGAGAVAVSTVTQVRQAWISDSSLDLATGADARVEALTRANIDTLALSGAGAGTTAVAFSNTTNNIDARTYARVLNSGGDAGQMLVKARDESSINSLSGGVAAAGSVAVGVATAVNRINNDIEASVSGRHADGGFALNDLGVQAQSDAQIKTMSVSGGFSGTTALNGGVSTSILDTRARALIDGGAGVLAQNNVAVTAFNGDIINSYAGVVAGSGNAAVSGLVTINVLQSETEAAIRDAATEVTALALGAGVSVDNGEVDNAPDTDAWADAEQFNPVLNLQTGSELIKGVAVRATSLQQTGQTSVSAAVSLVPVASASVGGVSNTQVLGGATLAAIDDAQINQSNTDAAADQQVSVGAASHSYSFGGVLNAALSLGSAALAVTADTGTISRDVTARVRSAKVTSRGAMDVDASATNSASNIVISASGALAGISGSASVLVLEGTTEALVDQESDLTVGSLRVSADAINSMAPSADTASGGVVGAGAGVAVGYNRSVVRAWIGAQGGSSEGRTKVTTKGDVSIEANSLTRVLANSVSVSGGGVGAAGSVNVMVIENQTEAGAGRLNLGSSTDRAGNLTVSATDRLNALSNAGSAAVGGVSLGASANVLVANNATRAQLLDSNLWLSGDFDLTALRESDVQLYTVTGGIGGSAALGGSIGVIVLGSGAAKTDDVDAMDELDKDGAGSLSMVDKMTSRQTAEIDYKTTEYNSTTGEYDVVTRKNSSETDWVNQQGQIGSTGDRLQDGTSYRHETVARISQGTVDALGDVNVRATDALYTYNLSGSAQLSGTAAVGAAASFTLSNARVSAEVDPLSLTSDQLDVAAETVNLYSDKNAVVIDAVTASAGFGVGLGAGVGVAVMDNTVSSRLGGDLNTTGLQTSATDALGLDVSVLGGQFGAAGAAGIVVAVGERNSDVSVSVDDDAELSAADDIALAASSEGSSTVKAQGASGGLLAGVQATVATAHDASKARISVGQDAQLTAADSLSLTATATPQLEAEGLGVAVGGAVAMGGTVLLANAEAEADVTLASGSKLSAHEGSVRAAIERNGSANSVYAHGVGVAGGLGLSVNAVVARAVNNTSSTVTGEVGSQLVGLSAGGQGANWTLAASTESRQRANTSGVTVGLLSLGANIAEAGSTNTTNANINSAFSGDLAALRVAASATNDSEASSVAGQGGLVSGAAVQANTWDDGVTEANWLAQGVAGGLLQADSATLDAAHTSYVNAFVDSTNAGLVGASGAYATNTVDAQVRSRLMSGSALSVGDYSQSALGKLVKSENSNYNVTSGSGGVVDLPAAKSITTVRFTTEALVGNNANLRVDGDWRNPGALVILAKNDFYARDKVKLDAGGAIAVTRAESRVDVEQADASVVIGSGADVYSVGAMTLASSTVSDIDARANTKAYGLAGAAEGYSLARVNAQHAVDIQSGAHLRAYGDVKLLAGADASGQANSATLVARTDLWNNTAFPVNNDPVARAIYQRDQDITIASGALVESVADVYAYAEQGYGNLTGKGVGKDLYREAAAAVVNGLGKLVGAGEVSFDINYDYTENSHSSNVVADGNVYSGIFNHQVLEINDLDFDTTNETVSVVVGEVSDGITYELKTGKYVQVLSAREEQLNKQLRDYGLSEPDRLAIEAELRLLRQRMTQLYLEMGGVIEGEGDLNFDTLPRDIAIQILEVDPIIARPGNILVRGDTLTGSGNLRAPGDASIEITNKSAAFLSITDLEIPNREGGLLRFNGASMENNADITNANLGGASAGFGEILVAANSPAPQITIINSYNPSTGGSYDLGNGLTLKQPAPDLFVTGAIRNLRGNVSLTASYGSVNINGEVRAQSISVSAGRDFILNSSTPFYHVGGDPSSNVTDGYLDGPVAGTGTVAGNNVAISAQYLNINGLLQSGVADWSVVINEADFTSSDFLKASSAFTKGTGERYYQLRPSDARTGTVGYSYDFQTGNIVLDAVEVGGGYMELTGHILSTGNGQINVLDGYSRVNVVNNSSRTLQISGIDLGSGVEGTLRINDINYSGEFKGNDTVTSTIYQRVGDDIQVYRGLSNEVATTDAYRVATYDSTRDTSYAVREGRSYVWLTGQDYTQTQVYERYVDKFWSLIKTGEWDYEKLVESREGPPTFIPGADYMGNYLISGGSSLSAGEVMDESSTVNTDTPISFKEHWTSCAKHFIWCQITRYHERETVTSGKKEIVRKTVRADLPISISFIGNDTGRVTLTANGDVVLAGSIFNETGTTSIDANNLTQASEEYVVAAKDLSLRTKAGIGSEAQALNVQMSGGSLSAINQSGNVYLQTLNGGVNLADLSTRFGDINLSAQGNVTANGGTVISGHAINLTSTQGSLGALGAALKINTDNTAGLSAAPSSPALFTASAVGDVAVEEVAGDLLVNQVVAGGDASISVTDGDLLDGNANDTFDLRSLDELVALWEEMQLSGDGAEEALEQQKTALVNAGNARYSRYWQLRNLRLEGGDLVADDYDPDFQPTLNSAQEAQLRDVYGWNDQQLADYKADMASEYQSLHTEFGGQSYNAGFNYVLSAAELDGVSQGSSWSTEQLLYSISRGLLRGEGGAGAGKVEGLNIDARNVILNANAVGSTLAEDVVIDLSAGFAGLTTEQRAALAGAEADDIIIDSDNPDIIRIIQREDVDIAARGSISVQADADVFLGGTTDFNLYGVSGDRIELKTDGSITSANGNNLVINGNDILLDAGGTIGAADQALYLKALGTLTARAQSLNLVHDGDLTVDYLLGRQGIRLQVDNGSLFVKDNSFGGAWQEVEHLAGGDVNLTVSGDIGRDGERLNISSNPGDLVNLDVGGNAWLGGIQGLASTPGALRFNDLQVTGRLDLANIYNLQQTGDWQLGALAVDVQNNWLADVGTDIQAAGGIIGQAGNQLSLGNLTADNAAAGISLTAATIEQNADALMWSAAGALDLNAQGDIGASSRYLRVAGDQVSARSDNGDLYLSIFGPVSGGDLVSLAGNQWLRTAGDVTLDQIAAGAGVSGDIAGVLTVTNLDAGLGVEFAGAHLEVGTLTARNGDARFDLTQVGVDQLSVSDHLDLLTSSSWRLGTVEVGGNALIRQQGATDVINSYTSLLVDGELDLQASGHVNGGNAQAGSDVSYQVGSALLGDITSTSAGISLNAAGDLTAGALATPAGAIQVAGGNLVVAQAEALNTIDMTANGDLTLGLARAGQNMTLTTLAGSAGDIRFGSPVTNDAELVPDHLYSGDDLTVEADGDVIGGNLAAEDQLYISGNNLSLGRAQSYTSDVQMRAVNDIYARQVIALRDIGIIAGGDLTMDSYSAERLSLSAGRDLTIGLGGNLNVSGYAEAGRDIFFQIGGDVDLLGMRAGRDVTVITDGFINVGEVIEAGGNVDLQAAGAVTVGERIDAGGNVDVLAGGLFSVPELTAGGSVSAQADGISLDNLTAGADIDLLSGGFIRVTDTSRSEGNQHWEADEEISFQRLLAGGQVLLDSLLDTRGTQVVADGGLTANAGWRGGVATPAVIELQQVTAPTASLWAGAAIKVADAQLGESADLHAQDVQLDGTHTGTGALLLRVEGLNNDGAAGDRFVTRLQANAVLTSLLDMVYTDFETSASSAGFDDIRNADYLRLSTPQVLLIADNLSPVYRPAADVQLYELDKGFWLYQTDVTSYTNAYVLHRTATHLVRVPNFAEGHQDGGVDYQGITAARYAQAMLTPDLMALRLGQLMNQAAGIPPAPSKQVQVPGQMGPVNLQWPQGSTNNDDEERWDI